MKTILACIEGTTWGGYLGELGGMTKRVPFAEFDASMSFMNAIRRGSAADVTIYSYGPDTRARLMAECVREPLNAILKTLGFPETGEPPAGPHNCKIFLAGYSRGAYAALCVAQALQKLAIGVEYLLLLDPVKVTDMSGENEITAILARFDKTLRPTPTILSPYAKGYHAALALQQSQQREITRSSEKGRYVEDPRDRARGGGNICDAAGHFVVPGNVKRVLNLQRSCKANSRMTTMGTAPVDFGNAPHVEDRGFMCTHSAMGGMPFRGDNTGKTSAYTEWSESRKVGEALAKDALKHGVIKNFYHPTARSIVAPAWWLGCKEIEPSIQAQIQAQETARILIDHMDRW